MVESTDGVLAVYTDHVREIYAFCLRRLSASHLAEEATNEVMARLVQAYSELTQQGKSRQDVRHWLYGTARNVIARFLRDARRRREIGEELARRGRGRPDGRPDDNGRLDWPVLYRAIGKLDSLDQDILVLRYFQGMETLEIAAILGKNHATIRSRLSRATERLRRDLEASFGQ